MSPLMFAQLGLSPSMGSGTMTTFVHDGSPTTSPRAQDTADAQRVTQIRTISWKMLQWLERQVMRFRRKQRRRGLLGTYPYRTTALGYYWPAFRKNEILN